MVVGTPSHTQHEWLENEERQLLHQKKNDNDSKDVWTAITTVTVADLYRWGKFVILYSCQWTFGVVYNCWGLVKSKLFGAARRDSNNDHSD